MQRRGVREKMEARGYDASSLTQSLPLLPFGCGGRYLHTDKSKDIRHDKRGSKKMRRCRFSIGSAPLTSITKSDAQISGGETRQDYKDTRRFPLGGSLVRSPVPAFRFTGVIPLLWPRLSHSTPDTQFRVGSSLQAGLYARTPRSVRLLRLFR